MDSRGRLSLHVRWPLIGAQEGPKNLAHHFLRIYLPAELCLAACVPTVAANAFSSC